MMLPRVGERLTAFYIDESQDGGDYDVIMTPGELRRLLRTKNFGVVYRYLGIIPLAIFFAKDVFDDDGDAPVSVRGDENIYGSIVVFGYDGSPRSLTEFELALIRQHVSMEKQDGAYTLILNDITKERVVE